MIVRHIGSEQARSYTCIGDTVNYNSCLENLNKHYGTQIMIDRQTATQPTRFVIREHDSVKVKRRETGESIFQLVGEESEIERSMFQRIGLCRQAPALYRNADFAGAAGVFATLSAYAPSKTMLKRSLYLQQNKPESRNGHPFHAR